MLRAVPMVHLRAQVPSRDTAAVTRAIAHAGLLHLVDLAHGRVSSMATPVSLDLLAAFRDLERRARDVARRLGHRIAKSKPRLGSEPAFDEERAALDGTLAPLERSVGETVSALENARRRLAEAESQLRRARALDEAGVVVERLKPLRFTELRLASAREEDLANLATLIEPAPYALIPLAREGDARLLAAIVPASSRDRLEAALRATPVEIVPLASGDAETLAQHARDATAEIAALDEQLARLRSEAVAVLDELAARAEVAVLLLTAQTQFASVGRFVVVSGWVPAADAPALAEAIRVASDGRAVVDLSPPEDLAEVASGQLKVPILHRNPLLLRPFQRLVGLYGTPSYREVEPTAFFAISFLLMFGLMFGDIGHGLVLFSAGFFLFRYFPRFFDYGILLMEGGASSTLFGFLYGSLFGRENLPALWLRPMEDLTTFMSVATGIGVVLISVGLVLNIINRWRAGQRAGALVGLDGAAGAFLYWIVLALVARALLPSKWSLPTWALLALTAVPITLIALRPILVRLFGEHLQRERTTRGPIWLRALEGSVELVDVVFAFFTNTFSFMRVAAFAAVHAGIMIAVNVIAETVARARFGGVWSIVALVAGNVLVIFLEGLTVSVQVLRLEYYEFFTRFFRGGGEPYRPLALEAEKGHDDGKTKTRARAAGDRDGSAAPPRGGLGLGAR